jgi:hypothetical protein
MAKLIAALVLLILFPMPSFADDTCSNWREKPPGFDVAKCLEKMLGKYLCVYDHVAGIQYSDKERKGVPFVGSIRPAHTQFFIEIRREASANCTSLGAYAPYVPDCKLQYELQVKGDDEVVPEHAYSGLMVQDFSGHRGTFRIYEDGRFHAFYSFGNLYVSQGRCQKIQ